MATAVLLAIAFVTMLRIAWVSDDAYITFRSVDNLLNGSVSERRQA